MDINELLETKEVKTLKELFEVTNTNYKNLHEHLGIKLTKLTRLINNPKEEGSLALAKDIARLTGAKASVIILHLNFGKPNISVDEMETLVFEEENPILTQAKAV